MDMLQEQVLEDRDTELNQEQDNKMEYIRGDHLRYVSEDGDDKKNIHALGWEVYTKQKGELVKREFLVSVPNPKGLHTIVFD